LPLLGKKDHADCVTIKDAPTSIWRVQGKLEKEERDNALDMMNFANKSSERQGTSKSLTAEQQKTHTHGNSARQETHTTAPPSPTAAQRFAQALWGPLAGLLVNLMLVVIKVIAGLASGSVALLADAGHSGADVANNVLVLASLVYARRGADETHPYGHDRAEVLAAIASAFILIGAGLFFGWDSIQKIIVGTPEPSLLALWVAIGTLVVKLVVAWIEMRIGKKVHSQAIQADARDNLADVLSSVAVIFGVIGAQFGNSRVDGIAGLVIAFLIVLNAVQIGMKASHELLDHNLDTQTLEAVRAAANHVPGVCVTAVTGREHGSDVLVELSIEVDPKMTVAQASQLADKVREAVHAEVPSVGDVVVELNTNHFARLRKKLR
jgi:cation diffusion facilitator family transporter